jgi:uncharacterized repeat protein (TIGR01451 family)
MQPYAHPWRRSSLLLLGLALAIALLALFTSLLYAQEQDGPDAPDRDFVFRMPTAPVLEAVKTVNRSTAPAGAELRYTVVISNSGESSLTSVQLTDTLEANLTYVDGSLVAPSGTLYGDSGNVITWTGALVAGSHVVLTYEATISDALEPGDTVGNTVLVSGDGQAITSTVTTTVTDAQDGLLYLPLVAYYRAPVIPDVGASATLPNSQNQWTLNWTVAGGDIDDLTGIEVHEAQDPDFDSYTTHTLAAGARSLAIEHPAGPDNVYYYRVALVGPWGNTAYSNVVTVIGNYFDDFSDPNSGWALRRTSYLEKNYVYYLNGNLVTLVDDRWDWVLGSPLRPAPAVPYAIEYRARVNDASNLVSGGIVFGGDWNGGDCPEPGNIYQTNNCFNQFYTHNYIFYGAMKLLWEKVNELVWCPGCGGSALKRIGDTEEVDPVLPNGPSLEWHTYRVEVREDGARVYIDGALIRHFTDTAYINRPYFGTFASTDEYKPSIWLYDWFQVTRLD